ncbi:hypothetical protein GEV33_007974 [Tenebrio molitor]|uniref:Integrase catalytic domain-containing protein n=1 Tax=Tenebrio molitor TaxID=7067 RepID=A0A8J6HIC2_TENMO|nr:hypothetical protein GEV33_007974 [Tenebrio molitor]
MSALDDLYKEFREVQYQIELIDNTASETNDRETFEDSYFDTKSMMQSVIDSHVQDTSQEVNVNLPQLNLPQFIDKVTENLPAQTFSSNALNLPQSLQLADPHFNVSGPIDMLMGAQLFWQILNKGQISLGHNKPVLQQTHLGWIIGGALNISPEQNSLNHLVTNCHIGADILHKQVERFFQIEDFGNKRNLSSEEILCEEHFRQNYRRDLDGRFMTATKRFIALETKLQRDPALRNSYSDFIHEYLALDHMEREHERQLHAGPQATLCSIRQVYWPISGRNTVRKIIHRCVKCFKANPKGLTQKMGDLPVDRLQPARPFIKSGIDYAGPIYLKTGNSRSKQRVKAYIALFICFTTKAIHIELVGDLTTESFLNALKRFISRRGHVAEIYSDNATNFTGASRELKLLLNSSKCQILISQEMNNVNIRWHFIPPRSPHFGGLWESVTYEEMYTLLTRVEACLNSRPLTPMSPDPTDFSVLTPAHFLIGEPMTAPLEPNLEELKINRLSRWQRIEQLRQQFWRRWIREYIPQLQLRPKGQRITNDNVQPGDMVLIKEDNVAPLHWPLGRVVQVHPGHDHSRFTHSVGTRSRPR